MRHDKIHSRRSDMADRNEPRAAPHGSANDNPMDLAPQDGDPLILLLAQMDIAATRAW